MPRGQSPVARPSLGSIDGLSLGTFGCSKLGFTLGSSDGISLGSSDGSRVLLTACHLA